MNFNKRGLQILILVLMAALMLFPMAGCSTGETKPAATQTEDLTKLIPKNVEVINEFGPGGGTDTFIRAIAVPFSKLSTKSLIPMSITGGGGVPAATEFLSRPADGNTIMAVGPEEMINHAMGRIDASQLMPLARIQYDQGLFFVKADSPYKTVQDLITYAKANPGKLSIGMTGAAGFDETLVGLWNMESGAELKALPFDSNAEASAALLGGHTDLMYEEYGPMLSLIQSEKVRALVVFSEERLPVLKDVPTAKELGYDVTLGRWRGFALKQGADPKVAANLYKIFEKAAQDPEYKNYEEKNMLHFRSKLLGPDEFKAFMDKELVTYTEVLKKLGYVK